MRISNRSPVNANEVPSALVRTDSPSSGAPSGPSTPPAGTTSSATGSPVDFGLVPSFELLSLNSLLAHVPPFAPLRSPQPSVVSPPAIYTRQAPCNKRPTPLSANSKSEAKRANKTEPRP